MESRGAIDSRYGSKEIKRRQHAWPAVLPALALSACTVGPDFTEPDVTLNANWQERAADARAADSAADRDWWQSLRSPTLDSLVDSAYRNNPNLQIAGVRVLQAQAQLNIAIGAQFPQQQALGGSVDYQYANTGLLNSSTDFTSNRIGVGATWELDFWGKYRRAIEADQAALSSTVAAYDDALVSLVANVANGFVTVRTLEAQQAVLESNAGSQREGLRIAKVRFENGETSALDVSQAASRLAETEAQIPPLQQQWQQTANTLSLLLGEPPGAVDKLLRESADVPAAPEQVDAGIPRDLLRRRPDVREALQSAASQSALIGVAESQLYPSFSLSGFFGYGSTNFGDSSLSDLFNWNSRFVQAGGSFLFPIFNYGRLTNQVRVQDAAFEQAVLNYQNTVLAAQQDVENSLATFVYGKRTVAALETATTAARRTTRLALIQYREGQTDFTAVLNAYNSQLQVENALAQSQGQVLLGLVSVYRALGGGWQIREGRSIVSDTVAADMRTRTDWGKVLPAGGVEAPDAAEQQPATGQAQP